MVFAGIADCIRLSGLLLALLLSSVGPAQARSLIAPTAAPVDLMDRFAAGRSLVAPRTTSLGGLKEYLQATGDGVTRRSFIKYGRDFEKYWAASRTGRSGKAFEAIVASFENRRLVRMGDARRLIVTAAEGAKTHPADLLIRAADSTVSERLQLKLGWKAAANAITEEKYAGMKVLLPRDQMHLLARELTKAEAKAVRRGLPLAAKWMAVKDAVEEGRLAGTLPSGTLTPTRRTIDRLARWHTQKLWNRMDMVGRWAGRSILVLDIAEAGYQTYSDINRFRAGEIGGAYLAARGSMRGVQVGLGIYAAVTPEPFSKTAAAAAILVIVVSSEITDRVHDARCQEANKLIERIDRDEKFRAVQRHLVQQIEGSTA